MLNAEPTKWQKCGDENLPAEHKLNNAEILFPQIEDKMIDKQVEKLNGSESKNKAENLISYDDFMKTQLKVAEVISAEKIERSKKLLKLKVKLDSEERQLVAGIAESNNPEDLIGKKVVIVANLEAAKIMGVESRGMILAVEKENGEMQVVTVDNSVKNGTRVK
jgi:methionyl-tRNA synthetase